MSEELMDELMFEIDERLFDPENLETLDGRELAELFKRLERLLRLTEGALATLIGEVDQRGVHRGDGHGSVNAWCRALDVGPTVSVGIGSAPRR
jgi:hypothetical protein